MDDFKLNTLDGDLAFANGDFLIGDTTQQEVYDILVSFPTFWKQFPIVGCSLELYQNGSTTGLDTIIRTQLLNDGFIVEDLTIGLTPLGELDIIPTCHR